MFVGAHLRAIVAETRRSLLHAGMRTLFGRTVIRSLHRACCRVGDLSSALFVEFVAGREVQSRIEPPDTAAFVLA